MHETVGWDEIEDAGRVKMGRRTLLNQGRKLLGAPSAETEKLLIAVDDPERLDRMIDAVLVVKSWDALLDVQ